MELLLPVAFIAGFLSILAPCTWPVLPLLVGASAGGGRRRPVGVILGLTTTFVLVTVALASVLASAGATTSALRTAAVVVLAVVAVGLLLPVLSERFGRLFEPIVRAGSAVTGRGRGGDGLIGGVVLGGALGLVWAPCVGPIMAGVIAIAASRGPSGEIGLIAVAYAAGAAIPLLFVAARSRAIVGSFARLARRDLGRRIAGVAMLVGCLAIATGFDATAQTAVSDVLPTGWTSALYAIEKAPDVEEAVRNLDDPSRVALADLGRAPELDGITDWINSEPLTLASLHGKVVLVHFWTFGCSNCRNVQPYVKAWYERYHGDGFEIIGVHTPELSFERDIANVRAAVVDQGVRFPVAFDPAFTTWRRFANSYWPAFYYVDRSGEIRYFHAGEGDYEGQEAVIRELLAEAPPT